MASFVQGARNIDANKGTFTNVGRDQYNITNNINSHGHRQYAASARFESIDRPPCLEGTRKEILDSVDHWINALDPETTGASRIFWINGLAGSGKTTIAYTVAKKCKENGILGASFFCSRDDADSSNPKLVFTTIADQLGQFQELFQEHVTRAHFVDAGLKFSSVSNQLEELLVRPLRAVRDSFPPCVVVLDALDECKENDATSIILASLSRHVDALAPLKFLVTSRPERKISQGFQLPGLQLATQRLNLHEVKLDVVGQDIELYLKDHLNIKEEPCGPGGGWPAAGDIRALTDLSSGLFIFAATAVRFIHDPNYSDPRGQLARLLESSVVQGSSPYRYLDQLYMQVLTSTFPDISDDLSRRLRNILGTVALLQYPLHLADIEQLLGLRPGTVRDTTLHLGSVLVLPNDDNQMIRLIHPSFFDFLTDAARCSDQRFAVDSETLHGSLARACLDAMKGLKRDICEIGYPSKLNNEVPDLSERIARYIPPHLKYASRSWAYHLSRCRVHDVPMELLRELCYKSLLHWMEVCSLLGELRGALLALDAASQLVSKAGNTVSDVLELLNDSKRFIREFFPVLSVASSHTYYSALPFTPTETALREKYNYELGHSVKILCGPKKTWDECLRTIMMEVPSSFIYSVAVSPNGAFIASGGGNGNVKVWDFVTGAHLQSFHTKHGAVLSVTFSPRGTHIASGSDSEIVQLWDLATGACLRDLRGHTKSVRSVVFSPDGAHIASGSDDHTIRIWDATGTHLRTLEGHSDVVESVAYSPNCNLIISGSHDRMVRIWEASGAHLRTLRGHSDRVLSVVYSPSGEQIISGSLDETIRIWGANGAHLRTLKGHTGDVNSVAYSPDGSQIISGSTDQTVRLWGADGGRFRTFKGHSSLVSSVAYSPDGTQIVSASYDDTIRIWNVSTGDAVGTLGWLRRAVGSLTMCSTSNLFDYLLDNGQHVGVALSLHRIATFKYHSTSFDLWDISGIHLSKLRGPNPFRFTIDKILFSCRGNYLAIVFDNNIIRLCSGLTGAKLQTLKGDWADVCSPVFSPNDAFFAFASSNDTIVRLFHRNGVQWDIRILHGHSEDVSAIAFSPDGAYLVSGSFDNTIRLWSTATGEELKCFHHRLGLVDRIYVSGDQKSVHVGSRRQFAIPQELWPSGGSDASSRLLLRYDLDQMWKAGWLYSESRIGYRVCWVPLRLRGEYGSFHTGKDKTYNENGCLLHISFAHRTVLCISHL